MGDIIISSTNGSVRNMGHTFQNNLIPTLQWGFLFVLLCMENEEYINNITVPPYYVDIMGVGGLTDVCISNGSVGIPNNDYFRDITLPERYVTVILTMCPEIAHIISVGYRETKVYCPHTFNPIKKFMIGVNISFKNENVSEIKVDKKHYESILNDYFKMTYAKMDFVTFSVESLIIPPEESNEDKFFKLFKK